MYVIYGEEPFLIEYETNKIIDQYNKKESEIIKFDLDQSYISEVIEEALTVSLFSNKKIIICKNSYFLTAKKGLLDHDLSELESYLANPSEDVTIIFNVDHNKIDVRRKIVKLIRERGTIIECSKLKNHTSFIKELFAPYQITNKDINLLVKRVGTNLGILKQEIEKIKVYKNKDYNVSHEDIIHLTTEYIEPDIFEFVNSIVKRDKVQALKIYNEMLLQKEEPIKIIIILANQFRLLYQVKELLKIGHSESEIASILESHPYPVKLAREKSREYNDKELLSYLEQLADLDMKIKSGAIDKKIGLEMFILEL